MKRSDREDEEERKRIREKETGKGMGKVRRICKEIKNGKDEKGEKGKIPGRGRKRIYSDIANGIGERKPWGKGK